MMSPDRDNKATFLESERVSLLKGISIELSREARKFTQEVEIPEEYQIHVKIFDPVESKKLPPSQPWCHDTTDRGLTRLESFLD